jgi:hypothetical protein
MPYRSFVLIVLAVLVSVAAAGSAAGKKEAGYQTGFDRWRAADGGFGGWALDGVALSGGALTLAPGSAHAGTDPYAPGAYNGRNYYNGGTFLAGSATSPDFATDFPYREAIASWNADTPDGTWIEARIQARIAGTWSKEFILGIWASGTGTVERHSVQAQGDGTAFVAVDTLVLSKKTPDADAYRLKFLLFQATGSSAIPTIRNASLAYSTSPAPPSSLAPGSPANWNTLLPVQECSQDVYPDGGEVWCSPTSTSMVLARWGDPRTCEAREHEVVDGVFDWIYDGHGNWPFNTAYAATQTPGGHVMEGYVARFTSMAQLETWVMAGVPVVISYAWKQSELDNTTVASSDGHLAVVVGFDSAGNPIVNDPATPSGNDDVQRTYDRAQLESLWLEHSGGTVYLMYPAGNAEGVLP